MTEYIEREKLEAELNHRLSFLMAENSEYDHYTSGYDEAVDTVEKFPSAADVMPVVHGQWDESKEHIYLPNGCKEWINFYCSGCEAPNNSPTDYCPNCGAKMDIKEQMDEMP